MNLIARHCKPCSLRIPKSQILGMLNIIFSKELTNIYSDAPHLSLYKIHKPLWHLPDVIPFFRIRTINDGIHTAMISVVIKSSPGSESRHISSTKYMAMKL